MSKIYSKLHVLTKTHQKLSYAVTRTFQRYPLSVINLPSRHLAFILLTVLLICRKWQHAYGLFTVETNLWHSHRQAHFVKVWNNDRQNLYCQSGTRCCQDHKIFHHFNEQLSVISFFFCCEGDSVLALDLTEMVVLLKNPTGSDQLRAANTQAKTLSIW